MSGATKLLVALVVLSGMSLVLMYRDALNDAADRAVADSVIVQLEREVTTLRTAAADAGAAARRENERATAAERQRDSANAANRRLIAEGRVRETREITRAAEMGETVAESFDSLRVVVAPELVPLVNSTEAQHDAQVTALESVADAVRDQAGGLARIAAQNEQQITIERQRGDTWERAAGAQEARADAGDLLNAALDQELQQARHPGILARFRQALPWMGGTAVVVCLKFCR